MQYLKKLCRDYGINIPSIDNLMQPKGVGVVVLNKHGKILTGKRTDNGQYCGAGGHIEVGENPLNAAIRETKEEFGITPIEIKHIGQYDFTEYGYGKPYVYLCTKYVGKLEESNEITEIAFRHPQEIVSGSPGGYFLPFYNSVADMWVKGKLRR